MQNDVGSNDFYRRGLTTIHLQLVQSKPRFPLPKSIRFNSPLQINRSQSDTHIVSYSIQIGIHTTSGKKKLKTALCQTFINVTKSHCQIILIEARQMGAGTTDSQPR